MRAINWQRVLLGGVVAAAVLWLLESAASFLYLDKMQWALRAHDLVIEPSRWLAVASVLIALLTGLTMMFIYAAVRPRLGPGPRTATLVACVLWLGGYVPSLLSYDMIRIYPREILLQWGLVGLLEMIIASTVAAWLYREPSPADS
ncbi:MAG: hypothetical protein AB1762_00285 [Gemmatimonadota bacterium]